MRGQIHRDSLPSPTLLRPTLAQPALPRQRKAIAILWCDGRREPYPSVGTSPSSPWFKRFVFCIATSGPQDMLSPGSAALRTAPFLPFNAPRSVIRGHNEAQVSNCASPPSPAVVGWTAAGDTPSGSEGSNPEPDVESSTFLPPSTGDVAATSRGREGAGCGTLTG